MLTMEYDYAVDVVAQKEESLEEGIRIGEERGREQGLEEGISQSLKNLILNEADTISGNGGFGNTS